MQSPIPGKSLYFPASQGRHGPPHGRLLGAATVDNHVASIGEAAQQIIESIESDTFAYYEKLSASIQGLCTSGDTTVLPALNEKLLECARLTISLCIAKAEEEPSAEQLLGSDRRPPAFGFGIRRPGHLCGQWFGG